MGTYERNRLLLTSGDVDGTLKAPPIGLSSYRADLLKALAPLGPSASDVFSYNLSRQQKHMVDRVKLREKREASDSAAKGGQEEKGHAALNVSNHNHHRSSPSLRSPSPPVSHDEIRFRAASHSPSRSRMATDGDGFYNVNNKSIMRGYGAEKEKGEVVVGGEKGAVVAEVTSTHSPHSLRSSLSNIAALAAKRDGGRVPAWERQHNTDGSILDCSSSSLTSLQGVLMNGSVVGNGRYVREERGVTVGIDKYAADGGGGEVVAPKGYVYESLLKTARSSPNARRHPKGLTNVTTSKTLTQTRANSARQQPHSVVPNPNDDANGNSDGIDNGYHGGGPSFASSHCLTNATFVIPSSFSSSAFESSTFLRHEAHQREEARIQSPRKGAATAARTRDDSRLTVAPQDPPPNSSSKYPAPNNSNSSAVVRGYTKNAFVNNTHTAYLKNMADRYARKKLLCSEEGKKTRPEDASYSRSSSSSSLSFSSFFSRVPPALHEEARMELTKAMASYLCEENLSKIDSVQKAEKLSSPLYPPPPRPQDQHNAQRTFSKGRLNPLCDDAARVALAGNSGNAVLPLAIKRVSSRELHNEKAMLRASRRRRGQGSTSQYLDVDNGVSSRSQSTDLSVTSTTTTVTTTIGQGQGSKRIAATANLFHNPSSGRSGGTEAYTADPKTVDKARDMYAGTSDGGDDDEWMTLNYTQNSMHSRQGLRAEGSDAKESPEESTELYTDDMVSEDDLSERSFRLVGEERRGAVAKVSSLPRRERNYYYQSRSKHDSHRDLQEGKRVEDSNPDILLTAARARRSTIGGGGGEVIGNDRYDCPTTEEQHTNARHTYSKKMLSQSGKAVVEEHHRRAVADAALSLIRDRGSPRGGGGRGNNAARIATSNTQTADGTSTSIARRRAVSGVKGTTSFHATSASRHERQVLEAIAKSHKPKATNTSRSHGSANAGGGNGKKERSASPFSSYKGADGEANSTQQASDLWSLTSQKASSLLLGSTIVEDLDTGPKGMGNTSLFYDPESAMRGETMRFSRRYLTPLVNRAEAASAAMSLLKTSVLPKVRKAYGDAVLREEAARVKAGDAFVARMRILPFSTETEEGNEIILRGNERGDDSTSDEEDTYLSPRTWQSSVDHGSRVFSSGAAEGEVRRSHNDNGGELALSLADEARSDVSQAWQRDAPEPLRRGRGRAEGQNTEGMGSAPTCTSSAYYRISVPKAVSPQRPNRGEVMARNALHSAHLQSPNNVGFGVPSSNVGLCPPASARKNTSSSVGLTTIGNITPIRARTASTKTATPSRRHNAGRTTPGNTPVEEHARPPSREMPFHAFKHPISAGAESRGPSMWRLMAGVASTAGGYVVAETFKV